MDDRPEPGQAAELEPGLRRVLAPNASPMTHWGTNTYLVGQTERALVDPGPDDPAHLAALLGAIGGARVGCILVTHAHRDHSAGVRPLAEATGAPVIAFGPPGAGRSAVMQALADAGLSGGGEGVDMGFAPDREIGDGGTVTVDGLTIEAIHTPGHFARNGT